ncbi:MAG: hypothetical protein NUV65_02740 [Candidatus Roizmanbacteria bacterium]|nr:hypothetical protein [Candidatus Roizmanbacteria bacterium]
MGLTENAVNLNVTQPILLSPDEIMNSIPDVYADRKRSMHGDLTFKQFIYDKCIGIRIGPTDVLIVDEDRIHPQWFYPELSDLAGASGTKAIMVEYFKPELLANTRRIPIIGEQLEEMATRNKIVRDKVSVSNILARIAQHNDKPVAVADIANKPAYMVNYSFLPSALLVASSVFHPLIPLAAASQASLIFNRLQEFTDRGHFDKKTIHAYEKILPDLEDARRVIVALGIQELASEYQQKSTDPSDPCRILVSYPKAHGMRIANYLTNQDAFFKATRNAKELMYRTFPFLDVSLRQYRFKESLARLTEDASLAGWQQFSNMPL